MPTVLATGWASLLLWISGIPLNPMSAALGALTIAIATEFGVILAGRFHEERRPAAGVEEALRRAYARTGAAVLASGVTAIAGFAVLIASEIQMLRDFGVVTVIDLAAALLGVMVVLPAALRLAGGAMRDRYSIVVGLLFLAVIVDRRDQHLGGRRRRERSGSIGSPPAGRCPSSPCRTARGELEGDANVAQDDCETSAVPCPEDAGAPRLPDRHRRARSASATSSAGRW